MWANAQPDGLETSWNL